MQQQQRILLRFADNLVILFSFYKSFRRGLYYHYSPTKSIGFSYYQFKDIRINYLNILKEPSSGSGLHSPLIAFISPIIRQTVRNIEPATIASQPSIGMNTSITDATPNIHPDIIRTNTLFK